MLITFLTGRNVTMPGSTQEEVDNVNDMAAAEGALADAIGGADKAAKGALAPFDKLNVRKQNCI